jgi:sugar lactone lactonase YvrE
VQVEQITEPLTEHGEGPVWDVAGGRLHWVDMLRGDVLTLDESADSLDVSRQHLSDVVAAVRPRAGGGLVLAVERGFAVLDPGAEEARMVAEVWQDPGLRMNEGCCDPQGRFYAGSMAYDARPGRGALHQLGADGTVRTILDDVSISNGIGWSPDGGTVYYVDTPTQRIDAFAFDAVGGSLTDRRAVVEIPHELGSPDGLAIDGEGGLWVALWDGGAVHRYTPEGRLDEVVTLPVQRVTACAFGGQDLDQLYVTTSRHGLVVGEQPQAGALFRAEPGVRGTPTATYAG